MCWYNDSRPCTALFCWGEKQTFTWVTRQTGIYQIPNYKRQACSCGMLSFWVLCAITPPPSTISAIIQQYSITDFAAFTIKNFALVLIEQQLHTWQKLPQNLLIMTWQFSKPVDTPLLESLNSNRTTPPSETQKMHSNRDSPRHWFRTIWTASLEIGEWQSQNVT